MSSHSSHSRPPQAAYVENEGETGEGDPTTRQHATIKKSSLREKERSKAKLATESPRKSSKSQPTQSRTTLPMREKERESKVRIDTEPRGERKLERRMSTSGRGSKSPTKTSSSKPVVERRPSYKDESRYYGVKESSRKEAPVITQPAPPASSRPRTRTSSSYHAPGGRPLSFSGVPEQISRPPLSHSKYFASPSPAPILQPASSYGYSQGNPTYTQSYVSQSEAMYAPSQAESYFQDYAPAPNSKERLAGRFNLQPDFNPSNPMMRPMSAQGFRQPPPMGYPLLEMGGGYESAAEDYSLRRNGSIRESSRRKKEEDFTRMPPPNRRNSFRQPVEIHDHQSDYYDYEDQSPTTGHRDIVPARPILNRPTQSYAYGQGQYGSYGSYGSNAVQSIAGRRSSYAYEAPRSRLEEQYNAAAGYQAEVTGQDLTIASLDKHQRRIAASSRSTQSSSSRDSEYKKSLATRTTRSGSDSDENITIHVRGEGIVNIAGAEIDIRDGTEVSITRRKNNRDMLDLESELSSQYSYPAIEERKTRPGRIKNRSYSMSSRVSTAYPPNRLMYEYGGGDMQNAI